MIDDKVRKLVDVLNKLPDVETFASCGGHAPFEPAFDQERQGNFHIYFKVNKTRKGWKSLELLAWAVQNTDFERLIVELWNDDVDKKGISFGILGIEDIDPNSLAQTLEDLIGSEKI